MTQVLENGDKLMEVHMKLEPSGLSKPKEHEVSIIDVTPKLFKVSGSTKRTAYKKSEVGVVLAGLFPDSFYFMERFGVCLPDNVEQFKELMLDDLHHQLVKFRGDLLSMQKHVNAGFSEEVDESIQVDWDRYRCYGMSECSQKMSPSDEGDDIDWSSTETVYDTIYVQIDDSKTGQTFNVCGLEGLESSVLINRLKKAIRAHQLSLGETDNVFGDREPVMIFVSGEYVEATAIAYDQNNQSITAELRNGEQIFEVPVDCYQQKSAWEEPTTRREIQEMP
jgi:hypothetical protein